MRLMADPCETRGCAMHDTLMATIQQATLIPMRAGQMVVNMVLLDISASSLCCLPMNNGTCAMHATRLATIQQASLLPMGAWHIIVHMVLIAILQSNLCWLSYACET